MPDVNLFRGEGKAETAGSVDAPALLNSLFEGKLGQFKARSSGIIGEMAGIKGQFISACDRFDLIDAGALILRTSIS